MKQILIVGVLLSLFGCHKPQPVIAPTLKTEKLPHDSDDPAIWVNAKNPSESIVFGTDKGDQNLPNSGVYAFDLNGKLLPEKSVTQLIRPNNVEVAYDFKINDSTRVDVLLFSERGRHQFRLFSIPEMTPLDGGGFAVFEDETNPNPEFKQPMGIASFRHPKTGALYAIVGRKNGPSEGYLYQYELVSKATGVQANLVRKFGKFSGIKEIEAIAVDNELGFVYFSDEGVGIRKYHADPAKGDAEISLFGSEYFKADIEGIAIAKYSDGTGYIIISDQQDHSFNIFDRQSNIFIKKLNLGTVETDGCEVTTANLGPAFPKGLFVSMNDERDFFYHSLDSLRLSK